MHCSMNFLDLTDNAFLGDNINCESIHNLFSSF